MWFGIEFKDGFVIYLAVTLGCLFGAMLFDEYRRERRQKWKVSEDRLGRCPDCGQPFIAERTLTSVLCPRCGRPCSVRKPRA